MYGTRRGTVTNPPSFEGLPDEALTSGTTELPFLGDEELREVLRTDISAAHLASSNGQWKAATGLVGSVVEALLHWLLQRPESQISIAERRTRGELEGTPRSDIRRWDLANYINVAGTLDFIKEDTETPALLTKDFRNLIHPGRDFTRRCYLVGFRRAGSHVTIVEIIGALSIER